MIDYETYTTGDNNDILVMEMVGRVDLDTAQFLFDCIEGHIEDGMHKIILDCSQLQYISSVGLGTLVRAHSRLKHLNGAVALAAVPGIVANVFRVTHLDRLFQMFPTVQEATSSFD